MSTDLITQEDSELLVGVNLLEDDYDADQGLSANIKLPTWDKLDERRILRDMDVMFHGFSIPDGDVIKSSLATIEDLNTFVQNTLNEIQEYDAKSAVQSITTSAALAVRKWALGRAINEAVSRNNLGSSSMQVIAENNNIGLSSLYHMRKVGKELDMREVYALGMYDAGWFIIRKISYIEDKNERARLIQAYVDSITDWNDSRQREKARSALLLSIKAIQSNSYLDVACSDPSRVAVAVDHSEDAPEYQAARALLNKLSSVFKRPSADSLYEEASATLENYYIADSVEGADAMHELIVEEAGTIIDRIDNILSRLPQLREELVSVQQSRVLSVGEENEDTEAGDSGDSL